MEIGPVILLPHIDAPGQPYWDIFCFQMSHICSIQLPVRL